MTSGADERGRSGENPGPEEQAGERAREAGGGGGPVHIGSMSGGSIATGRHGQATSYTFNTPPQQTDEATRALLEAVRALRTDMRVLAPTDETRDVDGQLDEIEGEITRTGRADPGRLARLRERLESGATAIGALASAMTVVQTAAGVLG